MQMTMNHHALTWCVATGLAMAGGCGGPDADVPPLENGWHVDAVNARQAALAAADQRVVYRYEWSADADAPASLTEYGKRHVVQIGRSVSVARRPVTVEPSGDAMADAARRRIVVATLGDLAVPDPEALVHLGRPQAYGTPGEEAAEIDADTPRGGQTNGTGGNNGSGSGGGLGGGGIGGGGIGGGGIGGGGIGGGGIGGGGIGGGRSGF